MALDIEQVSGRFRQRLSQPAMLEFTKRLIAIPSENPPGNQYEECAHILIDELNRLGFDNVRREGACILASAGSGSQTFTSAVTTMLYLRRAAISFSQASRAQICSVAAHRT